MTGEPLNKHFISSCVFYFYTYFIINSTIIMAIYPSGFCNYNENKKHRDLNASVLL
jgi:hypothetical protein